MAAPTMSDRRQASPAERAQARAVARWCADNIDPASTLPTVAVLALISKQFPDISLRVALTGYLFREALVDQPPVLQ
jgi:hypothetical protein